LLRAVERLYLSPRLSPRHKCLALQLQSLKKKGPQKKSQKGTYYSKRDEKETYYATSALALEIHSLAKK
jgi:hypothetical protein